MANRQYRRAAEKQGKQLHAEDVAIAYPHPVGEVGARFHKSLIRLQNYDLKGKTVTDGSRTVKLGGKGHFGYHLPSSSGANIVTARNSIVREFLESPAEWLWFIDSDMEFEPDTLDRLLETATEGGHKIVGGLCFALRRGAGEELVPTLYGWGGDRLVHYKDYPRDEVVPVAATGGACLLVHRSVLETIRDAKNDDGSVRFPPPWPWFAETIIGPDFGDTLSEDITFCVRAKMVGFDVVVDTRIKIGHQKPVVLDEGMFLANLTPEEPPAPTYVVIPVRGQWDAYTKPLLEQIAEQGNFEKVFLFDNAAGTPDAVPAEPEWLRDRNVELIPATGLGIHQMWNSGIKRATSLNPRCNVAILNNDLELGPEFLARLAVGLRAHPTIAAVCGNYDGREFPELVQGLKGICANRYDGTGGFAGFAFMARGELWAKGFPPFDERFEHWYGDNLFLFELERAGLMYAMVKNATVEHLDGGSVTDRAFADETNPMKERDRLRFEALVAGKPLPTFEDAA